MSDPTAASTAVDSAGAYVTAAEHAEPTTGKSRSLWSDAWRNLRKRPTFIISMVIITFMIILAVFPSMFTSADPTHQDLQRQMLKPSADAWFGYDFQGRDIMAGVAHGAKWSLLVGFFASLLTVLIGGTVGVIGGYAGGWLDGILSRIGDVFFGLPFVLGAIVILSAFRAAGLKSAFGLVIVVVLVISALTWPVAMRIMRSAAISAKQQDYVKAARALGANSFRIITKHMLPNCMAPVMVYATILFGATIGVEATLSFLGIGLRAPAISWGVMIAESRDYVQHAPHLLLFPAGFLVLTVLAFVMLGDAVRDALDPKLR
ncbi:oligopeptide transport system permease protein [Herbihabitans rhizosphaerae]|uniref:Oligopeptide transport system permease protein n=1 Tax=Herbihabitans rhizosphaerae TaxID=1872711 RepID=A0A4Q7KKF5_9PSEU|nr:ABC transporter permease [Herbihabitans rhizosphaerae]RZS37049.1 oligopeptide transport system permease protein [Herbihabitans rhizosphaerae]